MIHPIVALCSCPDTEIQEVANYSGLENEGASARSMKLHTLHEDFNFNFLQPPPIHLFQPRPDQHDIPRLHCGPTQWQSDEPDRTSAGGSHHEAITVPESGCQWCTPL